MNDPREICNSGVYAETNCSAHRIVTLISMLFDRFGLDKNELIIIYTTSDGSVPREHGGTASSVAAQISADEFNTVKNALVVELGVKANYAYTTPYGFSYFGNVHICSSWQ